MNNIFIINVSLVLSVLRQMAFSRSFKGYLFSPYKKPVLFMFVIVGRGCVEEKEREGHSTKFQSNFSTP